MDTVGFWEWFGLILLFFIWREREDPSLLRRG